MSLIKFCGGGILIIALIFSCFSINFSLEIKELLKKYSSLNSKLVSHSSLAERMKMERVERIGRDVHFNESFNEKLEELLSGGGIKFRIIHITQGSILLRIENIILTQFLDVFLTLSQDDNVEVSRVDIKSTKGDGYIYCDIVLRKK